MKTMFVRIIALLQEETETCQTLLECIRRERQAIIGVDPAALAEIGEQKQGLLAKLRGLDEQRHLALRALSERAALPVDDLTLQRLSEKAPPPYSDQLQRCARRLQGLVDALQAENAAVKRLVVQGMELVRGSYNLIAHLFNAASVYRPSGSLQQAASTGRLLHGDY